jgi:hypothetical protein
MSERDTMLRCPQIETAHIERVGIPKEVSDCSTQQPGVIRRETADYERYQEEVSSNAE